MDYNVFKEKMFKNKKDVRCILIYDNVKNKEFSKMKPLDFLNRFVKFYRTSSGLAFRCGGTDECVDSSICDHLRNFSAVPVDVSASDVFDPSDRNFFQFLEETNKRLKPTFNRLHRKLILERLKMCGDKCIVVSCGPLSEKLMDACVFGNKNAKMATHNKWIRLNDAFECVCDDRRQRFETFDVNVGAIGTLLNYIEECCDLKIFVAIAESDATWKELFATTT